MSEKSLPKNVINPFSEAFLESWDMWKQYKMEEFKFKYKGVISEQAALMQLSVISGSNEEVAVQIIQQSMSNGWKGLFQLKNNPNGQTSAITGASKQFGSYKTAGQDLFADRFKRKVEAKFKPH